jgi:hypothetical protein
MNTIAVGPRFEVESCVTGGTGVARPRDLDGHVVLVTSLVAVPIEARFETALKEVRRAMLDILQLAMIVALCYNLYIL